MKRKRYSPLVGLLGLSCLFILMGSVIYIAIAGFSYLSALLILTSVAGIAGPSVASGDGILDILIGVLELIVEGVQTIFKVIIDIISSIFG